MPDLLDPHAICSAAARGAARYEIGLPNRMNANNALHVMQAH